MLAIDHNDVSSNCTGHWSKTYYWTRGLDIKGLLIHCNRSPATMIFKASTSTIVKSLLQMCVTCAFFEHPTIQGGRHGLLETKVECCTIVIWNYHCRFIYNYCQFSSLLCRTYRDVPHFSIFYRNELCVLLCTTCSFSHFPHNRTFENRNCLYQGVLIALFNL